MTAFADRLVEAVARAGSPLCVGFDVFPERIPKIFFSGREDDSIVKATLRFGEAIIELAGPRAGVFKPQLGLLEPFGAEGYLAAGVISEMAQTAGMISILDAKRGDIGTTAEGYARAFLGERPSFDADAVTINPYMGGDTIEPFIKLAEEREKGVAVLVRTSNPGARDLQDLKVDGQPLWSRTADMIAPLSQRLMGESGWSGLMAVAGATYPDDAKTLRAILPQALFLVPGYGAQGASALEAVAGFVPSPSGAKVGGVVNASRSVLYPAAAHPDISLTDWRSAVIAALDQASGELRAACNG
ncbi:MAG: orotidine-5'-phosphate decarboxylase [Caulobacterales bacterium]